MSFYAGLIQEFTSGRWPENEFLIQVGFAAGWRSKSVMGSADNADPLLAEIVQGFNLDRGGKRKGQSRGYVQGQPFPVARHLAYVGDQAARPMGWLRVRAVPLEREELPTVHAVAESCELVNIGVRSLQKLFLFCCIVNKCLNDLVMAVSESIHGCQVAGFISALGAASCVDQEIGHAAHR